MGFGGYLRTRLWEMLFCAIAASALTYTLYSGFYACQPLQAWPQVAGVVGACAALTFVLYCIAYRTVTAIVGGVGLAVCVLGALAACAANSPGASPLGDVEGNYALAVGLASFVCVAVFLASRKKAGAVCVLVLGVMACALIEYLYWYGHVGALVAFLVGATGLIVFRGYQRNLIGSDSEGLAFTSVSIAALVLSAVAIALSMGVFYGVIAPMNPPNQQVKLIIEHRSQEEVEIRGVGSVTGDTSGGDGNLANDDEQESDESADDNLFDTVQSNVAELLGMDDDQTGDAGTTTALLAISFIVLIVIALVVLLVVLVVLIRKWIRRRRYQRMLAAGGAETVRQMYLFFLERFRRMKVPRPETLSLAEYVRDFSSTFEHFERFGCEGIARADAGKRELRADAMGDGEAAGERAVGIVAGGLGEGEAHPRVRDASAIDDAATSEATADESRFEPAEGLGRSAFGRLTDVYIWTTYGGGEPTDEDAALFKQYYRAFYKNARRYVGRFKYLFKFFRL